MRAALAIVLAAALPAAAQALYKWVDEKGVTHYSESPPEKGSAAKIELKVPPGGAPAAPDWKEREIESRKQRIERDSKAGEQAAREARETAERARRCRAAQVALDLLRNGRRVYKLDDKGQRVYLEDGQRPALIQERERDARENCT